VAKPIQTRPLGYLSLLALKEMGQNPDTAIDTLQPVIDLTEFYSADKFQAVNSSAGILDTQTGAYSIITVPNDQVWLIDHHSASISCNAAMVAPAVVECVAAFLTGVVGVNEVAHLGQITADIVGDATAQVAGTSMGRKYIAPGGTRICCFVGRAKIPAGAATAVTGIRYVNLLA
jgi:hypothetical protein